MKHDLLNLNCGDLNLSLAPLIGGSIAALTWRGKDVLRPSDLGADDPRSLGCFPMVPFAGRIAAGRFEYAGREIILRANPSDPRHAIHGQGWQRPWQVISETADSARLRFDYRADDWPWSYRAEQAFRLSTDRMVHTLSVVNQSSTPMPAGLGLHPYFPRGADLRLMTKVNSYAPTDLTLLPLAQRALPEHLDWSAGRPVTSPIDNPFAGWDGIAEISWPDRGLAVRMTTLPRLSNLVVYAPLEEDFICVEPISHAINALNTSPDGIEGGMKVLAPGDKLAISVTFDMAGSAHSWTD